MAPANKQRICIYDILVASETFEENLCVLEQVFEQIREAGLRVSVKKANFCRSSIDHVGLYIYRNGICPKVPIKII